MLHLENYRNQMMIQKYIRVGGGVKNKMKPSLLKIRNKIKE